LSTDGRMAGVSNDRVWDGRRVMAARGHETGDGGSIDAR
jgi:hypothetical protein